jgi:hypothetical protein
MIDMRRRNDKARKSSRHERVDKLIGKAKKKDRRLGVW